MLVIVAPFPIKANEKDGMIQRVAAIDSLMADVPRTYLDISLRRNREATCEQVGKATVHRLNFFVHARKIANFIRNASLVYVHSANNALKILPFFPRDKVVFDVHGVVPEETANDGKPLLARILGTAESVAISRSQWVISVSRQMQMHLDRKYGQTASRHLIYPILPHFNADAPAPDTVTDQPRLARGVIYAGGLQSWQNVGKMISASARQRDFSYTFLTGDAKALRAQLDAAGLHSVTCLSVSPAAVPAHYLENSFGYILREPLLINQVACPTKLIEYMYWGVLPIMITPKIGDFDHKTLKVVLLDEFLVGTIPDAQTQTEMRRENRATVDAMIAEAEAARTHIERLLLTSAMGHGPSA